MIVWIGKALALAIHDRQLAEHGGGTGVRDESLLDSALARPQPYLTDVIGDRPRKGQTDQWLTTGRAIETYRVSYLGLAPADGPAVPTGSPLTRAIGPQPTQPGAAAQWDRVRRTVTGLQSLGPTVPGPTLGRS